MRTYANIIAEPNFLSSPRCCIMPKPVYCQWLVCQSESLLIGIGCVLEHCDLNWKLEHDVPPVSLATLLPLSGEDTSQLKPPSSFPHTTSQYPDPTSSSSLLL